MPPTRLRHYTQLLYCFIILMTFMMTIVSVFSQDPVWNHVHTLSQRSTTSQRLLNTEAGSFNFDYSPWDTQSRDIPLFNASFHPKGLTVYDEPTDSFRDNLRPDLKYITAWGQAGFSNDFEIYMHLLLIGLLSGRVVILPPATGSMYTNTPEPPLYLSKVFDLERLSHETRVPILEWHHVKKYNSSVIDNLGGWSHEIEGGRDLSWDNIVLALNISMSYTQTPLFTSMPISGPGLLSTHGVVALTFPQGRKTALAENPRTLPSTMNDHAELPDEHLFTVRNLFYVGFIFTRDPFESDYALGWRIIGQHAHFTTRIESVAREVLRKAFGISSTEEMPPFIGVHIRRGDFAQWCGPDISSRHDCFTSVSSFARFVSQIKTELATREVNPVHVEHVYIASNEPRVVREGETDHGGKLLQFDETGTFWDEVKEMGWSSYDWEKEGVVKAYGIRYPSILEAAILSMGAGFVGTSLSTFSLLAKLRVETWNGGASRIVPWDSMHSADSDGAWESHSGI